MSGYEWLILVGLLIAAYVVVMWAPLMDETGTKYINDNNNDEGEQ